MYNVGSVFFGANSAKPGGAGTITGVEADNGVSIDPASTAANRIINLGQSWGEGGDPGELLHNTEIPLNGFGFAITSETGRTAAEPNLIFLDSTDSALGEITFDDPSNIFIGVGAGAANLLGTGINLVGIGQGALGANTSGNNQVAVGWEAMAASSIGEQSVAIGSGAMGNSTNNYQCVAIGYEALYNNPVTLQNVAIGAGALYGFLAEGANDAIGTDAGSDIITGLNNTLFGFLAFAQGDGSDNVIIGTNAGNFGASSNQNVIIGSQAVPFESMGSDNVLIGFNIENADEPGTGNVMIGANISSLAGTVNNAVVLGNGIVNILDNIVILGRNDQNTIIGGAIDGTQTDSGDRLQIYGGDILVTDGAGDNMNLSNEQLEFTDPAGDVMGVGLIGGLPSIGGFIAASGAQFGLSATDGLEIGDGLGNIMTAMATAITVDGTIETLAGVTWDFGAVTAGAVVLDAANYVSVIIGGVPVKLLKAA